jgi:hypothetical protein
MILLWAPSVLAASGVFELEARYEQEIQSYWTQKFPYGDGAFYALERVGDPQYGKAREPHQLVAIDGATGKKEIVTPPSLEKFLPRFFFDEYMISISGPYNRVSVFNQATKTFVGSKKLKDRILDAYVDESDLLSSPNQRQERSNTRSFPTFRNGVHLRKSSDSGSIRKTKPFFWR